MAVTTKTGGDTLRIYATNTTHFFLNWVAEGSDGSLYLVPSEPGGWQRRTVYAGPREALKPVSPEKAQAIASFVGGNRTGQDPITIAGSPTSVGQYAQLTEAQAHAY